MKLRSKSSWGNGLQVGMSLACSRTQKASMAKLGEVGAEVYGRMWCFVHKGHFYFLKEKQTTLQVMISHLFNLQNYFQWHSSQYRCFGLGWGFVFFLFFGQ